MTSLDFFILKRKKLSSLAKIQCEYFTELYLLEIPLRFFFNYFSTHSNAQNKNHAFQHFYYLIERAKGGQINSHINRWCNSIKNFDGTREAALLVKVVMSSKIKCNCVMIESWSMMTWATSYKNHEGTWKIISLMEVIDFKLNFTLIFSRLNNRKLQN